jgi:disulfide bond formation protein DsbB
VKREKVPALDRKSVPRYATRMSSASLADRFRASPLSAAAFAISVVAALTLAGAWFFELVLGLAPCPLCLDQRIPYYIAVPLGVVVGAVAREPARAGIARIGVILLGIVMLVGAGYGVYHAGVEWGFWEGPTACAAGQGGPVSGNILSSLKNATRVVPCNEAAWRFLGLSLAGYNALIAGTLAFIAFRSALAGKTKSD